ncbi:MAG TPA: methionyl-tRNA formyltransferase, partial [Brumimicrobium sp.]|nr:methionyl-tRNA formyltransferase [Brumimicrobium sp.]
LPQYRGAAPINWAIINGEKETGVTAFFIDEKIDTGEILVKETVGIGENETAGELHDKLMHLGASVVIDTVELIRQSKAKPQAQKEGELKSAPKIFKNDCLIDFSLPIEELHNFIRGMSPYPTAWLKLLHKESQQEKTLKIFRSEIVSKNKNDKLELRHEDQQLFLVTKNGVLSLIEIQLEGKKRLDSSTFLLGFHVKDWEIINN